jgi:hypothetical protein
MVGFKGFFKTWYGEDKQYDEGLFFRRHPLDVFEDYPPGNRGRIALIDAEDATGEHQEGQSENRPTCKGFTIRKELSLKEIVEAAVDIVFRKVKGKSSCEYGNVVVTNDDFGPASEIGVGKVAVATGNKGAALTDTYAGASLVTGKKGAALAKGDTGAAIATGFCGAALAKGRNGTALATNYFGAAVVEGRRGVSLAEGDGGAALTTGRNGIALTTGYGGAASVTGDCGVALATDGSASSAGRDGLAIAVGYHGRAKGDLGNWITLAEWENDENGEPQLKKVKSAKIDGKILKPDVWYLLKDGRIISCEKAD